MIFPLAMGLLTLTLLFLDLITKAAAYAALAESDYFLGLVRISYLPGGNTGIAFGWFGESEWAMAAFIVLTVLMMIGIAVLFFTVFKNNNAARVCLAVIEAGAIGNFLDRVFLGYVRDFIDVQRLHFGICNLADFFITFGAVALMICILFVGKDAVIPLGKWRKLREEEKHKEQTEEEGLEAQTGGMTEARTETQEEVQQ